MNTGASISPPIGSWLVLEFSLEALFFTSSGFALLSFLILTRLKETLPNKQPFHPRILKLKKDEIIDRSAILPAVLCMSTYFGYGAILTIVPDQSDHLGIANKGLFFTTLTLMALISRLVAGKTSDIYGRIPVMRIAIVLLAASYVFMGLVSSSTQLLIASGCIGFSAGIAGPAVFAWAIDRADDERRGRAMSAVYIGLEVAIGSGALLSAYSYANDPTNFMRTFLMVGAITLLGILFLWKRK